MNINVIVLALLGTIIGFCTWKSFFRINDETPTQLPWVPIDVNKPRSFVSTTRDAGMFTERARRIAIISNPSGSVSYKGSTNGSLEWNFLTSICVCPARKGDICPPDPNVIWSNGDADDEICDNVDAGGAFGMYDTIDFGGAGGNDCDV
jgi:hypothetical protein